MGFPVCPHFRTFLKDLMGLKSSRAAQPDSLPRPFPGMTLRCGGPAATVSLPGVYKGALPRVLALDCCPRQEAEAPSYHGDAGTACAHLWLMEKEEKCGCFRTG